MDFELTEKQKMLRTSAREFSDREIEPLAAQMESDARLPDGLLKRMAQLGLLGMVVQQQYGGGGSDILSCAVACEQLAYSGTGAWWLVGMNNSIPLCIARFGSEEIKKKALPPLCDGSAYASIQFTEDDTGSDPEALKTRATPRGDHYLLNGTKRFSTFGARHGFAVL